MKRIIYILLIIMLVVSIQEKAQAQNKHFSNEELAYMPATALLELFKQGSVSPVDVLIAQKLQWEITNPMVNTTTYEHFDDALILAKASEERYKNGTYRPLEGITFGVKDEHYDLGWRITQGSEILKDSDPKDHVDPIVAKMKEAGAIPVIQTTVPEFYMNWVTSTKAWGTTRSPWNLKYSSGGSSGGSGSALASGHVTLATGSDQAGSIRIPASFNGVYSIKPASGTFHTDGLFDYFAGSGPMARTFDDVVMMYNIISGPALHSASVMPTPYYYPGSFEGIEGIKIAYLGGMGIVEPADHVNSAMDQAIKVLEKQGAIVDRIDFDFALTIPPTEALGGLITNGAQGGGLGAYADKTDMMTDYAAKYVKLSKNPGGGPPILAKIQDEILRMYTKLANEVFAKGYDVVLVPTMPTAHVPADYDFTQDEPLSEDGIAFPLQVGMQYTIPFNLLNWQPIVNVPTGFSPEDMPIGMQIVGKPHDTESVLRVGYAFSKGGPKLYTGKLLPTFK